MATTAGRPPATGSAAAGGGGRVAERHPCVGQVLTTPVREPAPRVETGHQRDYTPGKPYGSYFGSPKTMFPVHRRSGILPDCGCLTDRN